MEKTRAITYIKDNVAVSKVVPNFNEINDVDSPSKWFESGDKPTLNLKKIPFSTKEEQSKLRNYIASSEDKDINVELVNAYLYHVGKDLFKDRLDEGWSLTTKIIIPKGDMNPFDLLNVIEDGHMNDSDFPTNDASEVNDLYMIISILANYRINSLNRNALGQYRNTLKTNMNATFKAAKFIDRDISQNIYNYTSWVNDPEFKKICAVLDLFFKKMPNNKYGPLRMCVQGARYKDCSLLTDIMFGKILLGTDDLGLFSLAVDSSVNSELMKYLDYISEDCMKGGYFPYLKELGVIHKSPYSATQSPNSHNWIHMIGALLGESRSLNSRLAPNGQNVQVLNLAMVCAYTLRTRSDTSPKFGKDLEEIKELRQMAGAVENESLNPRVVIDYLNELINGMPKGMEIKEWASTRINNLGVIRDGSIGKYLKDQVSQ